jgi:hypothetical protein
VRLITSWKGANCASALVHLGGETIERRPKLSTLNKWYRALEGAGVESIDAVHGPGGAPAEGQARWQEEVTLALGRLTVNMNPWLIVILVLIVLSLILAVMDRSFLSPMYLLVLALVVMVGTSVKFPW